MPSAVKDADKKNTHTLVVNVQSSTDTLENALAISYKVKDALTQYALLSLYPNIMPTQRPEQEGLQQLYS
jgi:hypothetical protein